MAWETAAAGAAGIAGQVLANQTNTRLADRQIAFQREMSNTSFQRAKEDLTKAGYNPLLVSPTGASTPPGALAQVENAVQPGITSAIEASRVKLESRKNAAEVKNLEATNELIRSQKTKNDTETQVMKKSIPEAEAKNMLWNTGKKYLQKLNNSAKEIWNDPSIGSDAGFKLNKPVLRRKP